jgi:hypothetical protein
MKRSLWLVVVVIAGCGRIEVDTAGKPCPCADGNVCDPICELCVPPGTASGEACALGNDCAVKFTGFRADWVTPNSIHWVWEPSDPDRAAEFQSYRLELSQQFNENTRTYDSTANPELGLFTLPNTGADLTTATITDGLAPGVVYTGTLIARDVNGCEFSSKNDAPVTTTPVSSNPIEIFGESPVQGYVAAQDGEIVGDGCHFGSQCMRTPLPTCTLEPHKGKCSYNLKLAGLDISITSLSQGQFEQAYLEFYAKTSSTSPSFYSWTWLRSGEPTPPYYRFDGFTLPAGAPYKRIQIPLRMLHHEETLEMLDHATLSAGRIREFNFGTQVTPDTATWVDEVYIRM